MYKGEYHGKQVHPPDLNSVLGRAWEVLKRLSSQLETCRWRVRLLTSQGRMVRHHSLAKVSFSGSRRTCFDSVWHPWQHVVLVHLRRLETLHALHYTDHTTHTALHTLHNIRYTAYTTLQSVFTAG
ncbi:unnamed protein product [Ostreobium quekettii]|uniref:Uncharacterized protein n=1 Tax=Ostreobium quekettii TaxID=121088 RepID=A0A8S1IPQ4_9CHLO|nr:unnamed protein product [Ostreobium quekettii]